MLKPRHASDTPVDRGFVRLAHGDVHYRAAGQGSVVIALHESPRSSLSMLPVIDALSHHFRVIAPDTPGYGLSDPLPADAPTLEDFVGVIEGLLDALGLGRVALYGAHTGAALALAFAAARPERVTALALDGVSAFTLDEVEAFREHYLAPYAPRWDGGHVMALWSRAKDLFTWFPWYDRSEASRLVYEPGDLQRLDRSFLGFVQAGRHYAKAYTLAAAFQPNAVAGQLRAPATIMARPDDLIAHHLDRLAPANWRMVTLDNRLESWRDALVQALGAGGPSEAKAVRGRDEATRAGRRSHWLALGDGFLHTVFAGDPRGRVRLMLPGLPGDLDALIAAAEAASPHARLVAMRPPGCGWSDPLSNRSGGLVAIIDALDAALSALDLEPESLVAEGAAAVIAQMWMDRRGWTFPLETLAPPSWLTGPLPDAPLLRAEVPAWDGVHVTSPWFQLRDLALYDIPPGAGEPVRGPQPAFPDVESLERQFKAFIEGPDCAWLLGECIDQVRRTRS